MLTVFSPSKVVAQTQKVVDLRLEPPLVSVEQDETFTLTIEALPNGQKIAGVEAIIDFDPTFLEVVDALPDKPGVQIAPGGSLPTLLANEVDNSRGEIAYGAGIQLGTAYLTTDLTVATITFRAKSPGNTSVTFITGGEQSEVAGETGPVLRSVRGAGVGIGGVTPTPVPEVTTSPAETPATTPTPPAETPATTTTPPAETPATTSTPPAETPATTPTSPAETPATTSTPPAETPATKPTPSTETPSPTPEKAVSIAWWIWLIIGAVIAVGLGSYVILRRRAY